MHFIPRLFAIGALAFASVQSYALAPLPTSGVCGFSISGSYPFTGVQTSIPGTWTTVGAATTYSGNSASVSGSLNMMGTVDFGSSTITINSVGQTAKGSCAAGNCAGSPTFVNTQTMATVTFTSGASSGVSGMYVLGLSTGGVINVLPVNGGKTLLLQQVTNNDMGGRIGVCQF